MTKLLPDERCPICGYAVYPDYACNCASVGEGFRSAKLNYRKVGDDMAKFFNDDPTIYTSAKVTGVIMTPVKIRKLHEDAVVPTYAHEGDAGVDLYALEDTVIEPGETALIKTGIAMAIPKGYEVQIRPRSGVTLKTKLRVQLGTIDCTYRGDIGVIVDNSEVYEDLADIPTMDEWYVIYGIDGKYHSCTEKIYEGGSYYIRRGDRIAQAILAPISTASFIEVDTLDESERGAGGFGSTGTSTIGDGGVRNDESK